MLRLLAASLLVTYTLAATAAEWRNRTIYQLITDRFATTDNSGPRCWTEERQYCGGTWKGIISKLDYIQDLGFDAIWISPVVANVEGDTVYGQAYHGYWTQDFYSLNSHFGTADDLKALSAALHDRSMYLMVDVAPNHMVSRTNPPDYPSFSPFSSASDFHPECYIDWTNQTDVEQCRLGDRNVPLADLNTEDEDVAATLYAWIRDLVGEYGIDGLRIDAARHVRKEFWPGFVEAAGVFTLGEVWHPDPNFLAPYTKVMDSVLDFPNRITLTDAFRNDHGDLAALAASMRKSQGLYEMAGAFLECHDEPRFPSVTQDEALIKNAMAWVFVQDGIPILYYGQEQGYTGGADPANREALWYSGYVVEDKPLVTHVRTLNAARRLAAAANSSFLTSPAKLYAVSQSTLAISKPPLLALLTNVGSWSSASTTWDFPDASYEANEVLVDVLSCSTVTADSSGGVLVHASCGAPQILLPASALSGSGSFCPHLAAQGLISSTLGGIRANALANGLDDAQAFFAQ
ncbi:glycoside hydrolase family 13 protein [Polyporus arcularius HHB13444]|uniref:alpha-amylase n=1 Tax=Polyporus arcularius HHB13444 TaxID=1314778 RepID=A0A5C3P991_9APHY|nr:glycoside hydrolase family 13 protein [Polyporus arcularius HHB13444]